MVTTPTATSQLHSPAVRGVTQALLALAAALQALEQTTSEVGQQPVTPVDGAPANACTGTHPDQLAFQVAANNMFLPAEVRNSPWHVVVCGRVPGIYLTHFEASAMVRGVPNFATHRCGSQIEALAAYRAAWKRGEVREWHDPSE